MVGNNTPIFFIRDGVKFPTFIHTQKRNPQTNLKDATAFWDFLSSNQECAHEIMHLFSDRGTPLSYRHMNTYSGHTFKFTKKDGSFKYVKIHVLTVSIPYHSLENCAMEAKSSPSTRTKGTRPSPTKSPSI